MIKFKRATYERFAPFFNKNGLVRQITTYGDLEYKHQLRCWEFYQNRNDHLESISYENTEGKITEHFSRGRKDFLMSEFPLRFRVPVHSHFSMHYLVFRANFKQQLFDAPNFRVLSRIPVRSPDTTRSPFRLFARTFRDISKTE